LVEIDAQAAEPVRPGAAANGNRAAPPAGVAAPPEAKKKYPVEREPCVPADPE
jgi:hypothetical protein